MGISPRKEEVPEEKKPKDFDCEGRPAVPQEEELKSFDSPRKALIMKVILCRHDWDWACSVLFTVSIECPHDIMTNAVKCLQDLVQYGR